MSAAGRLEGRVIWVTGAGRGLGRAIASALVEEGAEVVATSRSVAELESLRADCPPGRVIPAPASVTDAEALDRIAGGIASRGPLHGLVNCAGISPSFSRSEHLDPGTFGSVLETNVLGTFLATQSAARVMLEAGMGSIVNVGSVHATAGYGRIAAYAASKGAVHALTRALAVEWADRGVRVNTLTPGYFPTELSRGVLEHDRLRADILGRIPMGRTGEPEELARAAVFLLSDDSSYMTGADLDIDGGWRAW